MKYITFILIIIIVFFSANFNLNAQTLDKRKQNYSEKDQQELKQFVGSFLRNLNNTKDLAKVSDEFFIDDFKTRFASDNFDNLKIDKKISDKIDENIRYEYGVLQFNLKYLAIMYFAGKMSSREMEIAESNDNESENECYVCENYFPPEIEKLFKETKTLSRLYESDFEIKTSDEFNELVTETNQIIAAQTTFLEKNALPKSNSLFVEDINDLTNGDSWYKTQRINLCSGNYCEGLPEKTPVIEIGGYIQRLKIAIVNGKPKIINIFLLKD